MSQKRIFPSLMPHDRPHSPAHLFRSQNSARPVKRWSPCKELGPNTDQSLFASFEARGIQMDFVPRAEQLTRAWPVSRARAARTDEGRRQAARGRAAGAGDWPSLWSSRSHVITKYEAGLRSKTTCLWELRKVSRSDLKPVC